MKAALASYHNKVKKELGNLFMKRTPVQEETSQEEEERIKAEFSSRLSPSPTDVADLDNIAEGRKWTFRDILYLKIVPRFNKKTITFIN